MLKLKLQYFGHLMQRADSLEKTLMLGPKKKKCKKAKWLSEESLQIAAKRKEVKHKGEKERYIHLKAEFQRTVRTEKTFLSEQCKEI